MKFILWTLVWLTYAELETIIGAFSMGGLDKYMKWKEETSRPNIRFISACISVFLWIFLYNVFIR